MGRWYEIASLPSRFQPKNGENTRATYTLNEDGTVHVLNETWTNGKRGYVEGTAYKADPNDDEAKLKILCRQTHLDDEIYNQLEENAQKERSTRRRRRRCQGHPRGLVDQSQCWENRTQKQKL